MDHSTQFSLEGCSALVTGASGNIGRAIAVGLAEAGADVVVHYSSNGAGARETCAAIESLGQQAYPVKSDLADPAAVEQMFREIDRLGRVVTALVNNAGTFPVHNFLEMTPDQWRAVTAANLDSALFVTQAAVKRLREHKRQASIVNIASIEAFDPAPGHSHYSASKAGLVMLSRSLTLELGQYGIRVNSVSPGLIGRPGIEEQWPEGVKQWQQRAPLGQLGDPKDIAHAVLFFLSPGAKWISGANLVVDGGMSSISKW